MYFAFFYYVDFSLNIVFHPPNRDVFLESQILLNVFAIGAENLTYQWFHNGSSIIEDSEIEFGTTTDTYVIFRAQFFDAGTYTVQISSPFGMVESLPGIVTVGECYAGIDTNRVIMK